MWNYGSLDKDQELNYVKAKMVMVNNELEMYELYFKCMSTVLNAAP